MPEIHDEQAAVIVGSFDFAQDRFPNPWYLFTQEQRAPQMSEIHDEQSTVIVGFSTSLRIGSQIHGLEPLEDNGKGAFEP